MRKIIRSHGIVSRTVILILWTLAIFCYFFQFPVSRLSSLIVPFLALFVLAILMSKKKFRINENWGRIYGIYFLYLVLMAFFSIAEGEGIQNIIRFFLILIMIPLFCVIEPGDFTKEKQVFIFFAVLKCLLLLYYAFLIYKNGSYVEYRSWARENNYGDMYINPSTGLPSIMVQGNGILPVAFLINLEDKKISASKRRLYNIIILIGIVLAGNMAFILAIAAYCGIKLSHNILISDISSTKKMCFTIMLIIAVSGFIPIGLRILSEKADWSNAIRLRQAKVLLDNYIILGNGLGHGIYADIGFRVYNGDTYFELQTLYIYNQIGLIGLIAFYYLIFSPFSKKHKLNIYILIVYIIYSFWNPYCFDTTEMMTIALLVNYPLSTKVKPSLDCLCDYKYIWGKQ